MLICVLQIPLSSWERMTENDRDQIRVLTVTEYCEAFAKKHNVHKFSIREKIEDGFWKLFISPIKTEV
jgi:hypothetical protein